MRTVTLFFVFLIIAYLLGSIPFGKIIASQYGINIQKKGSGNIGFANCLRILGWNPALLVLAGDILKGFIPLFIALVGILSLNQTLVIAIFTIIGHIFPIWLKFKGGKGIATGLGITLALNPLIALAGISVFLGVVFITKTFPISSIFSAWLLVLCTYLLAGNLTLLYFSLALLATWTHRENIKRIIKGTEIKTTE